MKDNSPAQIQSIVDQVFPQLLAGEITLDSILEAYPDQAEALRACLSDALWINSQQSILEPQPAYLAAGKQRLLAQIRSKRPGTTWQRLWSPHTAQRFAMQVLSFGLILTCLVLVVHNLILASRLAIPGDWLYPVKLNIERIQLARSDDPQEIARLSIEHTQHRTTEIVQLALEDDLSSLPDAVSRLEDQIRLALDSLETATRTDAIQAAKLSAAMQLMLENETFILTLLRDVQPASTHTILDQAIAVAQAALSSLKN